MLTRKLAVALGVPSLEIDSLYNQADWQPLPADELRARVAEVAAADGWVIDGNYPVVQPVVWARADTVVFLDLPRRTVARRIVWRTLSRLVCRVELWNGNRERWRNVLTWDPEKSMISYACHRHPGYRSRYEQARRDPANAHLAFIRLASQREVRAFVRVCGQRPEGSRPSLASLEMGFRRAKGMRPGTLFMFMPSG